MRRQSRIVGLLFLAAAMDFWGYTSSSSALVTKNNEKDIPKDDNEPSTGSWQDCHIFLAPSGWQQGGFGVFSNRPFYKNEIVELAPWFLPLDLENNAVQHTALYDYTYGYLRLNNHTNEPTRMVAVSTGATMIYNHASQAPNVGWGNFGDEPSSSTGSTVAQSVGFLALRDIAAGEELFSHYGTGNEWFRDRNLPLMDIPTNGLHMNATDLHQTAARFCSKIYSGIGQNTWKEKMVPTHVANRQNFTLDPRQLPPSWDAGIGYARTKVTVAPNTILETAPALILPQTQVRGTALAPLVFRWSELDTNTHQRDLYRYRSMGALSMQYQGPDTGWSRQDVWLGYEQIMIFAAAGSIASVRRVGRSSSTTTDKSNTANCRLEILVSGMEDGNAGIVLQLIATKEIAAGQVLKLDLPPTSASKEEKDLLRQELIRTGQPLPPDEFFETIESMPQENKNQAESMDEL